VEAVAVEGDLIFLVDRELTLCCYQQITTTTTQNVTMRKLNIRTFHGLASLLVPVPDGQEFESEKISQAQGGVIKCLEKDKAVWKQELVSGWERAEGERGQHGETEKAGYCRTIWGDGCGLGALDGVGEVEYGGFGNSE
jgi:hypothetical protein